MIWRDEAHEALLLGTSSRNAQEAPRLVIVNLQPFVDRLPFPALMRSEGLRGVLNRIVVHEDHPG